VDQFSFDIHDFEQHSYSGFGRRRAYFYYFELLAPGYKPEDFTITYSISHPTNAAFNFSTTIQPKKDVTLPNDLRANLRHVAVFDIPHGGRLHLKVNKPAHVKEDQLDMLITAMIHPMYRRNIGEVIPDP